MVHQAMHSSRELESSSFEITVDGRELRPVETYRRIGLDEALGLPAPKSAETTRRPLAATR
jgi:hypothetical protein